jgi:DNA polymerase-4
MEKIILHSDLNNCYASAELTQRPELRDKPVAVGGSPYRRHGIILAKNEIAKKAGVKTGSSSFEAERICPGLIILPPRMDLYLEISQAAREIYGRYSDICEPYGIDEAWIDVTNSAYLFGGGEKIAREINAQVKKELGVTVSVGVSWTKVFAKMASDYKKPDAVTTVTRKNYKELLWPLPIEDMFYAGRATGAKLRSVGVKTVGGLARAPENFLRGVLGKWGVVLRACARGEDVSFFKESAADPPKSIGNSSTAPRDLVCGADVWLALNSLAESVGARLREQKLLCGVIEFYVRDNALHSFTRQSKMEKFTNINIEIAEAAYRLFEKNYAWERPIRSVGIRATGLVKDDICEQLDMFTDNEKREKRRKLDAMCDEIRERYGYEGVRRGVFFTDGSLGKLNAKKDHFTFNTKF